MGVTPKVNEEVEAKNCFKANLSVLEAIEGIIPNCKVEQFPMPIVSYNCPLLQQTISRRMIIIVQEAQNAKCKRKISDHPLVC